MIYNIGDRFLHKNSAHYKGVLYDLGAGESPYRDFFLKHVDKYVAVDWPQTLHESQADVSANLNELLPIADAVADTVVSISVMEHLYEPQMMLNEALRILKPGGMMLLQVPWQWQIHEAPHDYFRYTPYALEYLLTRAGLVDITIEAQSGFFTTWVLKFNYFSLRLVGGTAIRSWFAKILLYPLWYIGQKVAPVLDKLDHNWQAEACGYFLLARKNCSCER